MKKMIFALALLPLVFAACGGNETTPHESPVPAEAEQDENLHADELHAESDRHTEELQSEELRAESIAHTTEIDPDAMSFETGDHSFSGRGSGEVSRSTRAAHSGNYSLLVTGRTASWNGIQLPVTEIAEPFGEYEFSLWVRPTDDATTFQLSAEFILDGNPTWRHFSGPLASVTARPGEWTHMRGLLPFYGFDTAAVYIETNQAGATADFFIDDVVFRSVAVEYDFDPDLPRLFEIYADYFLLGTAVVPRDMRGERLTFINHHFNAVTAGNDMKPDALQPRPGDFTWAAADMIVNETLAGDMYMIGHTLAWHAQSPEWMNPAGISREDAIRNLETHIYEVVSRYRGQVLVWDVVNEAFPSSIPGGVIPSVWRAALRPTPWLDAIGPEFIEIAFRAAHAADPDAILIYNDYNLDNPRKREAVFHMVQELLENGVPIHGVGMQGHYNLRTNPQDVEDSILRFAELGIPVSITELDITAQGSLGYDAMREQDELAQAILYARLFQIFREHSDVIHRVTIWGLDDATSWRSDRFPLPFNRDLSAKKAFAAIADPAGFLAEFGE
ncbi:MAG: endo-1,4-beta-xylanase [Defluviitaleaceae bacterium]|nr:endo-1,4-beta-xylanase [Defluviitaleaceae bacterium]